MKLRTWGLLFLGLALCSLPAGANAQSETPFYGSANFDSSIPTPESYLGYPLGSRFTEHYKIVGYLKSLAEVSDRVDFEEYGTTYEGRPLVLLTISSSENLRKKDDIQKEYARLSDPRNMNMGEARGRSRDLPVASWFSFNIHGNEPSPSEAAMAVAYHLAASTTAETRELLDNSVLLLDPCLNPDGRDRYTNWINSVAGKQADPTWSAREHHEPWPGGRQNHYLFDLNRDWAWLSQQETKQRAKAYLKWRPQVHVDFHEMGEESTYFFFPAARPIHPLYPPQIKKWGEIFGRGNAEAFDARGWRYYTAESFDLYYPSYGDSWPTFHGAIGMTYEQAGHRGAGTAVKLSTGGVLTLKERTEHHYTAALATLKTAVDNREARLLDYYRFFQVEDAGDARAYLLPPGSDPPRTADLVGLLIDHGAEVYRSRDVISGRGLRDYDGRSSNKSLPEGTYVVPMNQPLHRFLRAILEPETALPDTLFYDVSAWSLPLAFGVEAYTTTSRVGSRLELLSEKPEVPGVVTNPRATYAYLISWARNGTPAAATWLQSQGARVHFTSREIETEGTVFPAGSLVIFCAENDDSLPSKMDQVANEFRVDILGVNSGLTTRGPDLGSRRIEFMKPVRVALLADSPVDPTSLGACWFLLDQVYNVPHSLVRPSDLTKRGLKDFDVLVAPDAWGGGYGYTSALDSARTKLIKEWIEEGGVFVGLGAGAFYATQGISGLSSIEIADASEPNATDGEAEAEEKSRKMETTEERIRRNRLEDLPGTIFEVTVDPLHPLGFGYEGTARVLKISDTAFELGPEGTNVAIFSSSPKVSGYASEQSVARLVDRPFLIAEPVGDGHVVLYAEDPNFRLFWYGLTRLFLNSIYFLPSLN